MRIRAMTLRRHLNRARVGSDELVEPRVRERLLPDLVPPVGSPKTRSMRFARAHGIYARGRTCGADCTDAARWLILRGKRVGVWIRL
jgi:hypothetical protein